LLELRLEAACLANLARQAHGKLPNYAHSRKDFLRSPSGASTVLRSAPREGHQRSAKLWPGRSLVSGFALSGKALAPGGAQALASLFEQPAQLLGLADDRSQRASAQLAVVWYGTVIVKPGTWRCITM
jgi:hypothetical protein